MNTTIITFSAIENSGVSEFTNYYWNGVEFIKSIKTKVNADHLEYHTTAAMEWIKANAPLVALRSQPFQIL